MQDTPIALLVSYLKRIEGFKIGSYEAALKTRELNKLYKLDEIEPLVQDIVEIAQKKKVVVLIDELDKGWDNSEDAKAFVAGLFQASISLNEHTPNLGVFVSLRQELYDSIPALYEDAQKYRDVIETIQWDEPVLLEIVANRIRYNAKEFKDLDDIGVWNNVFAETLQYRNTKSFNYIVDRTLYGPRESIQFCTDCVEEWRRQQITPIYYQIISNAELRYSDARTKDIAAEYRFQNPGLQSIFECFRGRPYRMSKEAVEELCLSICSGELQTNQSAKWVTEQDHEYLIDVLWRIGFLKAYAVGGLKALRRSGSSYVGPYQVSTLNLRTISRFQVHPMFRSYLGMREEKDKPAHNHE